LSSATCCFAIDAEIEDAVHLFFEIPFGTDYDICMDLIGQHFGDVRQFESKCTARLSNPQNLERYGNPSELDFIFNKRQLKEVILIFDAIAPDAEACGLFWQFEKITAEFGEPTDAYMVRFEEYPKNISYYHFPMQEKTIDIEKAVEFTKLDMHDLVLCICFDNVIFYVSKSTKDTETVEMQISFCDNTNNGNFITQRKDYIINIEGNN